MKPPKAPAAYGADHEAADRQRQPARGSHMVACRHAPASGHRAQMPLTNKKGTSWKEVPLPNINRPFTLSLTVEAQTVSTNSKLASAYCPNDQLNNRDNLPQSGTQSGLALARTQTATSCRSISLRHPSLALLRNPQPAPEATSTNPAQWRPSKIEARRGQSLRLVDDRPGAAGHSLFPVDDSSRAL